MAEKQSPGWKKYFKVADTTGQLGPISGRYADGYPQYGKNNGLLSFLLSQTKQTAHRLK